MFKKTNQQTAKKQPSILRKALKISGIGCGLVLVLFAFVVAWIAIPLFSGPGAMEISEFHPFRSADAKAIYHQAYFEQEKEWPLPFDTLMIPTAYGRTFVRVSGAEGGQPLVLLSGGGSNSLSWRYTVRDFADYRIYAIDNIYDVGLSVYSREMTQPEEMVRWLDATLNQLDLDGKPHIMGLSYGGWLAAEYALAYPEAVEKLVLIAPAATILPLSPEWISRALKTLLPPQKYTGEMLNWLLPDLAATETGRQLIETTVEDAIRAKECFKFKMLVNPRVLADSELVDLPAKTLFLIGENEKIYPSQAAVERIQTINPAITVVMLPNCGHGLMWSQPEAAHRTIRGFLTDASRQSIPEQLGAGEE